VGAQCRLSNDPKDTPNQINPENIGFVRSKGYLAIVLITDEDDCSADPDDAINDSIVLADPEPHDRNCQPALRGDVGHVCNGLPIPGYEDPSLGYQPPKPLPAPKHWLLNPLLPTAMPKTKPNPATGQTDPPLSSAHHSCRDMINSVNQRDRLGCR